MNFCRAVYPKTTISFTFKANNESQIDIPDLYYSKYRPKTASDESYKNRIPEWNVYLRENTLASAYLLPENFNEQAE